MSLRGTSNPVQVELGFPPVQTVHASVVTKVTPPILGIMETGNGGGSEVEAIGGAVTSVGAGTAATGIEVGTGANVAGNEVEAGGTDGTGNEVEAEAVAAGNVVEAGAGATGNKVEAVGNDIGAGVAAAGNNVEAEAAGGEAGSGLATASRRRSSSMGSEISPRATGTLGATTGTKGSSGR